MTFIGIIQFYSLHNCISEYILKVYETLAAYLILVEQDSEKCAKKTSGQTVNIHF